MKKAKSVTGELFLNSKDATDKVIRIIIYFILGLVYNLVARYWMERLRKRLFDLIKQPTRHEILELVPEKPSTC
jgi:hypothetical protein